MRKIVRALFALGLVAMAFPALALDAAKWYVEEGGTSSGGGPTRSNDCLGDIVWDVGMTDDFTPPAGCSSAAGVGCFVNAINDGGFPADGRRLADDWIADTRSVTGIKIWSRLSASGYTYHQQNPGSLHGFCVRFYQPANNPPNCPDGTVPGDPGPLGAIVYDEYVTNFVEHEIAGYQPRNFNYCITLPGTGFTPPQPGHAYYVSVSSDFDFTTYNGGVTQWFGRVHPGNNGGYDPYCEASWWDTWNTPPTPWNAVSVGTNLPCWAGWDVGFVLYSNNVPPVLGACCDPSTGACIITMQTQCPAPSVWHPEWTTCDPNPCPLSFFQLDFNLDGTFTSNSDWGVVDLTFTGSDQILYFNLTVNGSWQVQDVPVLTLHGTDISQTQRFWFDLENEIGIDVDHLHYGYALTPAPLGGLPAGDVLAPVGNDTIVISSGAKEESLGPAPPAAGPTVGGGAADPVPHRLQNYPNQQCHLNECAPTAVSNSLQFLSREHGLGLNPDNITIAKMRTATKWEADGCWIEPGLNPPHNAWWQDKADYMRKYHFPITTRMFNPGDIAKLIPEIDAKQDIEATLGGHTVSIVALTPLGGGRYSVTVAEDSDQFDDTTATTETTGTWDSNTGTWGGALAAYHLSYFIVECPREPDSRTQYSVTEPGMSRPPTAPWVPVAPGGVDFPGTVGAKIWLAKNNLYVAQNEKSWTIVLTGLDADKYGVNAAHGYINTVPVTEAPVHAVTSIMDNPGPPKRRTITVRLKPQPDWEVIELIRTGALAGQEQVNIQVDSHTTCVKTSATANTFSIDQGWIGVLGDTLRITEVMIFPNHVPVDPAASQTFVTDPQFGAWSSEIVYQDPSGQPRPQGGVRWYTSGSGLGPEDDYSLNLVLAGQVDSTYACYAYDTESGAYQFYKLTFEAATDAVPELAVPSPAGLEVQVYPSPFNLSARLTYRAPIRGSLSIKIYDVRGALVRTLIDKVVETGTGVVTWDGRSDDGRTVASGVYIYHADAAGAVASGPILLIK